MINFLVEIKKLCFLNICSSAKDTAWSGSKIQCSHSLFVYQKVTVEETRVPS